MARPPMAAAPAAPSYEQQVQSAQAYVESGKAGAAAALAGETVHLDPNRCEAYRVWARALAQQDQLETSAAKYEMAHDRGCRDLALYNELTSVYDVTHAYDKAVALYLEFLKDHPDNAAMRDELALTYLLLGKYPQAVSELQIAQKAQSNNLQIAQDLGYALVRAERFDEGREVLSRVVQADPQRSDATRFLAQANAGLGDLEAAERLLGQVLHTTPRDRAARIARARIRALGNQPQTALEDYQQLLQENPDDGPMLLGAAGAMIGLDRLEEAKQVIERARKHLGDIPQVNFRAAQVAWRQGDVKALRILQDLAKHAPTPTAANEIWQDLVVGAKRLHQSKLEKVASQALAQ